ncbi:dynein assembly factor 3, axonemal homolog [Panicum hallii]|uniref:dynein assembly factor 3, axonemal homolog n=1 Tax=Panicum hallii TaxID=206008 RepID=UPI000DF4DB73|nr:dynein assembly factor 3, axonemal homolog [Panicum hallii]
MAAGQAHTADRNTMGGAQGRFCPGGGGTRRAAQLRASVAPGGAARRSGAREPERELAAAQALQVDAECASAGLRRLAAIGAGVARQQSARAARGRAGAGALQAGPARAAAAAVRARRRSAVQESGLGAQATERLRAGVGASDGKGGQQCGTRAGAGVDQRYLLPSLSFILSLVLILFQGGAQGRFCPGGGGTRRAAQLRASVAPGGAARRSGAREPERELAAAQALQVDAECASAGLRRLAAIGAGVARQQSARAARGRAGAGALQAGPARAAAAAVRARRRSAVQESGLGAQATERLRAGVGASDGKGGQQCGTRAGAGAEK